MRNVLIFFISLVISFFAYSQSAFRKNTFYFEIGGNGPVLSVNYERQLSNKPGFGVHIGVGLGDSKPDFPMGIIYIYSPGNNKSFIEAGAGITLAEQSLWDNHAPNLDSYPYKAGFVPSIGYRHHTNYGLMWRINYTPFFSKYRNIPLFFGISVGWRI